MVPYRNTQQGLHDVLMAEQTGIEPVFPDLQSGALTTFATVPFIFFETPGLEPKSHMLKACCSSN